MTIIGGDNVADMTREEVIEDLTYLYEMDDYGSIHKDAIKLAISDIKRVEHLEKMIENLNAELTSKKIIIDGLKEGIVKVKAEIKKYTAVDICKVSHVLHIINKYLGE